MRKLFSDNSKVIFNIQSSKIYRVKVSKSREHAFRITRLKHTHTRNIDIKQEEI